jgi:hypothetical protein
MSHSGPEHPPLKKTSGGTVPARPNPPSPPGAAQKAEEEASRSKGTSAGPDLHPDKKPPERAAPARPNPRSPPKAPQKAPEEASRGKAKATFRPDMGSMHDLNRPTKLTPEVARAGSRAVTRLVNRFASDASRVAQEHGQDKDVAEMLETIGKAMDVHNFVSDPMGFVAHKIHNELIERTFKHFSEALEKEEDQYIARFPAPAQFRKDPLEIGTSLEQLRIEYEQARAAYAVARTRPDKQWSVLGYELTHSGLTREQGAELIKKTVQGQAQLPALGQWRVAKLRYAWALVAVRNRLGDVRAELATQRKDLAQDLTRRGHALGIVSKTCRDVSQELLYFAVFPSVEVAWYDFEHLADGFGRLADHFALFANVVEGRESLYARDAEWIERESKKVGADQE